MIVGPTSCGKTFFVRQLLQSDRMVNFNIEWYYNQHQQTYNDFARTVGVHCVMFKHGLPKYNENYLHDLQPKKDTANVIDDLRRNRRIWNFSQNYLHKDDIATFPILSLQKAFLKGKYNTEIAQNAMHMALSKSPADRAQISQLEQKMFSQQNSIFMNIYRNETARNTGTCWLITNQEQLLIIKLWLAFSMIVSDM